MTIAQPELRRHFWHTVIHAARHNPSAVEFTLIQTAFYLHLGHFSRHVIAEIDRQIIEAGTSARDGRMVPSLRTEKPNEAEMVAWH
jgi:hypothetical protein